MAAETEVAERPGGGGGGSEAAEEVAAVMTGSDALGVEAVAGGDVMEVRRRKRHRVEREEAGEGPAERGEQRGCVGGDGQRGVSLRSGKRYCMSRDVGVACKHGHVHGGWGGGMWGAAAG